MQSETAECGLACIAAIARFHGADCELSGLRLRFGPSNRGTTLSHLIRIAAEVGITPRPLRAEPQDLPDLKLPAILHWDLSHYVVLQSVSKRRCRIMDPALGPRDLDIAELSRHFTGIALELTATRAISNTPSPEPLSIRQLLGSTPGVASSVAHGLLLAASLQLLALLTPVASQWILDRAIPTGDRSLLAVIALASILLAVLNLTFSAARSWLMIRLAAELRLVWSGGLFARVTRLPLEFFQRRSLGDTLSRLDSMRPVQDLLTQTTPEILLDGAMATTTLALMFLYSPALASLCATTWILYALLRLGCYPLQYRRTSEILLTSARERSCLLETLRTVATWKQRSGEMQRCMRYQDYLARDCQAESQLRVFNSRLALVHQALAASERVAVLWFGAGAVISGEFTVGMLVAFLAYKNQFSSRVAATIDRVFELRNLGLHLERLGDFTGQASERTGGDVQLPLAHSGPVLELINLGFRHSTQDPWLFRNLELRLEHGEWLAISAPSGAGKSTLARIIGGLLDPAEGRVRYKGQDIRSCLQAYRKNIGVVLQGDELLAGTLAENICFFDTHPDRARIEAMARIAGIHEEINAWPLAYFTRIGELSHGLSAGQLQRLLLARALYHRPRLLLLDEAFSHLDGASERRIIDSLRAMGTACVFVSHRESSLRWADRVLELTAGPAC
jgi:ATP-binding cassette subfamily B protein RaxB